MHLHVEGQVVRLGEWVQVDVVEAEQVIALEGTDGRHVASE